MMNGFEEIGKASSEGVNRASESLGALARGWQMLMGETFGYSKQAFADGAAHMESLLGARSLDGAIEAQTGFVKESAEKAAGQAARLGEITLAVARDTMKPFQGVSPTAE